MMEHPAQIQLVEIPIFHAFHEMGGEFEFRATNPAKQVFAAF